MIAAQLHSLLIFAPSFGVVRADKATGLGLVHHLVDAGARARVRRRDRCGMYSRRSFSFMKVLASVAPSKSADRLP
jgi:hypothetical protein